MKTREDCVECEYVRYSRGPVCCITGKMAHGASVNCPKEGPLGLYAAAYKWSKIRGGYVIAHSVLEARLMYARAIGYSVAQVRVVDLEFPVNDWGEHAVYMRNHERLQKMGVHF